MTQERIEAAAKAIFEVRDDPFDTQAWHELDSVDREPHECQARVALAAADLHDSLNRVQAPGLEEIRERWDAATPGPWFREYSDVITNDPDPRDTEEGYEDPRSLRIVRGAPHLNKRDRQGIKNATAIAHAPADVRKLLRGLDAVEELCVLMETDVDGAIRRRPSAALPDAIRAMVADGLSKG